MSTDVTTGAEASASATATASAPPDLGAAARRMVEEPFNEGRFELVDQLIDPGAMNHDPAEPPQLRGLRGPELYKRTVEMYRAAFPDVHMTVDDVIVAGDKTVVRWHSEGTHLGELEGYAPSGARGSVTGIGIDQWKDGKVIESWLEWDNLGLARQIGAAPPEGSIGEKIGMRLQHLIARGMRRKSRA